MRTAKLTLMFLACAAAIPAMAQNTTDSRCGMTNYDSSRNMFTITNPTPGTATQQCFITVVSKDSWAGGIPNLSGSQLVEGNYEVTLAGGGGGGGGGAGGEREHGRNEAGNGGGGGYSAIPVTTVRYLQPGVYRVTIGSGGQGGTPGPNGERVARAGGNGGDGAPTSLANANSGETIAGFSGAESWNGTYPLVAMASVGGPPAPSGARGDSGGSGAGSEHLAEPGAPGGNGFIKLALKDPPPQAVSTQTETAPAPAYVAPAETVAPVRPARRDRN